MFQFTQEDFKALCVMMGMQTLENMRLQEEAVKLTIQKAALEFEMNEMQIAASELHESYVLLQDYSTGVAQVNDYLRHRVESKVKNNEAIPSIDNLKVSTLITAMTAGNKMAIADAVHKLLPSVGLQDCIDLAVNAVRSASGIIGEEMEDGTRREDAEPIIEEEIPDTEPQPAGEPMTDSEEESVIPHIGISDSYPIDGVSVG